MLREELLALVDPSMDRSLATHTDADAARRSCSSSASTAPARPPPPASSPGCSSPTAGPSCSVRPTRSARPRPSSCRPGASGSAPTVVPGPEGGDPASVAFDAVKHGGRRAASTSCVIDTAGRLHTKTGLMDELGKVKRVVEKQAPVDEVLLVLDATTGQNGLRQARVFAEVVDVTGHRAHQARRHGQGRHRGRRAARARRARQARRPRRGSRRPGAVRRRGVRRRAAREAEPVAGCGGSSHTAFACCSPVLRPARHTSGHELETRRRDSSRAETSRAAGRNTSPMRFPSSTQRRVG